MDITYSIAICPPQEIIDEVKVFKLELAEYIGWFGSKNSDAHITLNNFIADEKQLHTWKTFLKIFCESVSVFEIHFDRIDSFRRAGALYLAPDENSEMQLRELMERFHKESPIKVEKISTDPHMSIARRLRPDKLGTAFEFWKEKDFDLRFECSNLAIRQFDPKKKQYFIESRWEFGK